MRVTQLLPLQMAKATVWNIEITCYIFCHNVLQSHQDYCATSWPLETASRQHGAEDQTGRKRSENIRITRIHTSKIEFMFVELYNYLLVSHYGSTLYVDSHRPLSRFLYVCSRM